MNPMTSLIEKRHLCEELFVAVLDRIIAARGLDGELLFLPQNELRARDLLRGGRVPDDILDEVVAIIENILAATAGVAAKELVRRAT